MTAKDRAGQERGQERAEDRIKEARVRVLIVDDSAVMRSLLRAVIAKDAMLEVAGTVSDGAAALNSIGALRPDVMLLDVEMPVMDGLTTLRQLRARGNRMPVIMCSSLTQQGARITVEALSSGASDSVAKPHGVASREAAVEALAAELIPKIRALTHVSTRLRTAGARGSAAFSASFKPRREAISAVPKVVAIAVSTGGPAALSALLPALPAAFPLPIVIVQHMPEHFTRLFAERMDTVSKLRVREATEGELLEPGTVWIAQGGRHLEALAPPRAGAPVRLHLTERPAENHCRPSADVLFRSLAQVYGQGVLAVVLTGMGSDGLNGCRSVRQRGGTVLVQDAATSTVWGMPGAVAQAGLAHWMLPLMAIAPEIVRIVSRVRPAAVPGAGLNQNIERAAV
jgi:two-component system, chemotaxis family, protein-glutamate methylesterase/glutaminase